MRVMAQLAMVINLDRCIGCHHCSVACREERTSRAGFDQPSFSTVETRSGSGDVLAAERVKPSGGWVRTRQGKLILNGGGRLKKLGSLFSGSPRPATAEPDAVADARAEACADAAAGDPVLAGMSRRVTAEFESAFRFFLPRLCEHCLNPSCAAACPAGALYKRNDDGIVLVDPAACSGWQRCVTACPYGAISFDQASGTVQKCDLCAGRIELGQPTACSESCVGRIRYLGLLLYDADRVADAARVEHEHGLLDAQRDLFLDPRDPAVIAAARAAEIPDEWIDAARRTPLWSLIREHRVALPFHPEYRTLPMVWYIPPLSPIVDVVSGSGGDGEDVETLLAAIDDLRAPVGYLAGLFTAGDPGPVTHALRRLAAMRSYRARVALGGSADESIAERAGMTGADVEELYRLLADPTGETRHAIPAAFGGQARDLGDPRCGCGTGDGPGTRP